MRDTALGVILLTFSYAGTAAQNLVPNSSFEEHTACPGSYSRNQFEFRIKDWYSPNAGTPDGFHDCSRGEAGVPYNWAGISEAFDGKGYAGIYVWIRDKNYREYLQCRLREPLTRDTTYQVRFHYKLSSYSKFSINRIGLLLSDTAIKFNHHRAWDINPTLHVVKDSAIDWFTGSWEVGMIEIKARGGEEFLTIGNFDGNHVCKEYLIRHRPVQEEMISEAAYYYIDEVIVKPKYRQEFTHTLASFSKDNIELEERYVLDDIHFSFDSFRLLPRSFAQLDELVGLLRDRQEYKILLSGHTDDSGSESYNLSLSQKRARTVAMYLIGKGISSTRIESVGYGKKFPVVESNTEESRRLNRRVELKFYR